MIQTRKRCPALAGNETAVIDAGNPHVFGYRRRHAADQALILANFSQRGQTIAANVIRTQGLGYEFHDLVGGGTLELAHDVTLEPYQLMWLV
jgi:amylosucrase/maltose alpha-D-glucosyltransferase/alpha-amylase